jgi:hypothetical protein
MAKLAFFREMYQNVVNLPLMFYSNDDFAGASVNVGGEMMSKISGSGGFEMIGTVAMTGKQYKSVVIQADAVVSAFAINGTNALVTSGLSTVNPKAGAYLPAVQGQFITAITLTSGSAIGYL